MKKIICISSFMVLFVLCAPALYPRHINFKGGTLTDSLTGYAIMRSTIEDITALTNINYKFGLIFPNSKDWIIDIEGPDYFLANSDSISVSLQQIHDSTDTNQYLDEYSNKISEMPGLKSKEILLYMNTRILKNVIDINETTNSRKTYNLVQYNYFVVKNGVKSPLFLHMSFLISINGISNFDEEKIKKLLAIGFKSNW